MKKYLALLLIFALLLTGCGKTEEPVTEPSTEAPTTEATTEPTTEPTEPPTEPPKPVIRHPLTGVELEEPLTTRIFGVSIGNTKEAMPHYGVSKADIVFETFVNGLTTRRYALYSDIASVEAIGGSRSMRIPFVDMSLAYDTIAVYAGGSEQVMGYVNANGIEGIISQRWGMDYHWREEGKIYEHALMVRGDGLVAWAEGEGYRMTQDPEKDYGFRFTENGAPEGGEDARVIDIGFTLSGRIKDSILTYNEELNGYTMVQYELECVDGYYDVPEVYKNVFVLLCENVNQGQYHVATTVGDGEGYYACDGKIIPIQWHRADNNSAFTFTLTDGTRLEQGIGSSYIAIAPLDSYVIYGNELPAEEEV